jgi:GNAT superfamily N-acetyltransferase
MRGGSKDFRGDDFPTLALLSVRPMRIRSLLMSNTRSVSVREATVTDVDSLVASGTGLFAEDGAVRDRLRNADWPRLYGAEEYARNIGDPDMLVLVGDRDGQVVGHLTGGISAVSPMWNAPRAYLISMYVMPPWRGQNLGARLVGHFKSWAKDMGAVQLRVTAYAANEGAIRFYQRHGFAPLEDTLALDI